MDDKKPWYKSKDGIAIIAGILSFILSLGLINVFNDNFNKLSDIAYAIAIIFPFILWGLLSGRIRIPGSQSFPGIEAPLSDVAQETIVLTHPDPNGGNLRLETIEGETSFALFLPDGSNLEDSIKQLVRDIDNEVHPIKYSDYIVIYKDNFRYICTINSRKLRRYRWVKDECDQIAKYIFHLYNEAYLRGGPKYTGIIDQFKSSDNSAAIKVYVKMIESKSLSVAVESSGGITKRLISKDVLESYILKEILSQSIKSG